MYSISITLQLCTVCYVYNGLLSAIHCRTSIFIKAYHKAIEEKKQHGIEIQAAKGLLTHGKTKRGPVNQKDSTNTTPRAIG